MAKWMTRPVNFGNSRTARAREGEDQGDMGLTFLARDKRVCEGTERMYKDPDGPDMRRQTWDDYVNKAGRARGVKCETYDPSSGATADGHVGYLDRKRDKAWDNFVGLEETSKPTNKAIERMNNDMCSDNEEAEWDSEEEGGPGTAEVKKLLSYAEHQRIKLDRLFEKCKDEEGGVQGRPVYIAEMPSKMPERDVNQVPETMHNIMGSCAGAGSGEFHSFRKSRRREYARQSILRHRELKEKADMEYADKVNKQKEVEDSKTAKKRAKRQKEKERKKLKRVKGKSVAKEEEKSSTESEEEAEEVEKEKPAVDPYSDPLMRHPVAGPPLVIAGDFRVDMAQAQAGPPDTRAGPPDSWDQSHQTDSDTDSD